MALAAKEEATVPLQESNFASSRPEHSSAYFLQLTLSVQHAWSDTESEGMKSDLSAIIKTPIYYRLYCLKILMTTLCRKAISKQALQKGAGAEAVVKGQQMKLWLALTCSWR